MDTFSHAAWGVVSLRVARKDSRAGQAMRRVPWWGAALAGAAPDLLFAIPLAVQRVLGIGTPPPAIAPGEDIWKANGPPLPQYLVEAYDRYYVKSHSLLLVAIACAILWASGGRHRAVRSQARSAHGAVRSQARSAQWLWLAVPYALHILVDIPTHERFETQPLWPLSSWRMQGLTWGDPRIFFPNVALLACAYVWLWKTKRI